MNRPITIPIRVAVVEDKLAFRRGVRAIFDLTPGIECVGLFATADEALREIPKSAPDVVLMDLNLPGLSGIECTRELRKCRPGLPVVVLTIEEESDHVFSALRAGATGYLLKTATPAEIVEAIHLAATGGSPMSALIARRVVESFHNVKEPSALRYALSPREVEVLHWMSRGKRVKEVAAELNVSTTTVQTYLRRVYEKLQVHSQATASALPDLTCVK